MAYDLGTAHGKIVLDYNGDKAVDGAERDIDRLKRKSEDGDKSVGRLGKTLGALGKGVSLVAVVGALTNAAFQAGALAIQVAGIIPSLVSIASLSAALPGIYAAIAVSVGVMKAALSGVGDAVKAAFDTEHPEKFDKALKELSPHARDFALAFRDAVPALKEVQQGIQDAFFENGFEALVPRMVSALQTLSPVLKGLAFDFGEIGQRVASFLLEADSIDFLNSSVVTFRDQLAKILPVIDPLLEGIRAVGFVGQTLMNDLGTAVAGVATRFAKFLSDIAADGRLEAWIDTALATLKDLGAIIKNVFSILNSVLGAAQATGGGLLNTLAEITGQFADFLKSAEGSEAMRALFAGILETAKALTPVITVLVKALAGALGPVLTQLATEIGPVLLDVVEALAPAFGPLAKAIADVLVAVAPLLPPLAKLVAVIAIALAQGLTALADVAGPVIDLFSGALLDALVDLAPLFTDLARDVAPLAAAMGAELLTALRPLIPVILQLAQTFIDELIPVLPQLIDNLVELLPYVVDLAAAFSDSLVKALTDLIPLVPFLVQSLLVGSTVMTTLLQGTLLVIGALLKFGGAIGYIKQAFSFFSSIGPIVQTALSAAWDAIVTVGAAIGNWFQALPGRIVGFLKALPGMLADLFRFALQYAATAVGTGIGLIVGLAVVLPQRIGKALVQLGPILWGKIVDAWNGARARFSAGVTQAVAVANALPGRIGRAINSLGAQLANIARNAWNRLVSAFNDGRGRAESTARDLPGRIIRAIGNLGNLLYNSGVNVINGLINGIRSGISRVMGMVGDLANRVRDAFNSALSIFSPSRDFHWSGEMIGEGLIDGIKAKITAVKRIAETLAKSVIAPTVALPAAANAAVLGVGINAQPNRSTPHAEARNFGPYHLEVDGRVIASIVIDTVTGNPKVVSKAAGEGDRQDSWAGSGRKAQG